MYFVYFIILTVVYLTGAAVVIVRHYRNHSATGGEATHTELSPVAENPETEPLSNIKQD